MDVLDETVVLKGGGLNLDGTRETTKVKMNEITSAVFDIITMTSATNGLLVRGERRLRSRSGLGRLNNSRHSRRRGHSSLGSSRLLLPGFRTRGLGGRRNRGLWFDGRGRPQAYRQEQPRQRQTQAYREQDQEQERDRPTIYRTGAAVVSTITSM